MTALDSTKEKSAGGNRRFTSANPKENEMSDATVPQEPIGIEISEGVNFAYSKPSWATYAEVSTAGPEANLTFSGPYLSGTSEFDNTNQVSAYALQDLWLGDDGIRIQPAAVQIDIEGEYVKLGAAQATGFAHELLNIVASITTPEPTTPQDHEGSPLEHKLIAEISAEVGEGVNVTVSPIGEGDPIVWHHSVVIFDINEDLVTAMTPEQARAMAAALLLAADEVTI